MTPEQIVELERYNSAHGALIEINIELRIADEIIPLTCKRAVRIVEQLAQAQAWSLRIEIESSADKNPKADTT